MATHSSSLAWKIPWMEEPGRLHSPWGCKESDTTEQLHFHFSILLGFERVTGRKARGLQVGNRLQVSDIFSLLSGRRLDVFPFSTQI